MKRIITLIIIGMIALFAAPQAEAQWIKDLGKKAVKRAKERSKQKVEDKVNEKVDKTVDKVFETGEDIVTGKEEENAEEEAVEKKTTANPKAKKDEQPQVGMSAEMVYAKSDFVPGDEIIFEDNMMGEKLGEFPGQWDPISGTAEIVSLNGQTVIAILDNGKIAPLMENMKEYLPEAFTIEFEVYFPAVDKVDGWSRFCLETNEDKDAAHLEWWRDREEGIYLEYFWTPPSGDSRKGNSQWLPIERNNWQRFAISFNKRALKVYVNGIRMVNIPNCTQPGYFYYEHASGKVNENIRNIRIAQGAVPLYDRMMSDGKFITYGITFDVGKSTIKPESMGEINRIVQLMTENPDLKFSVEGHTDSTGNATSNQTLSEARSTAIVDKLVEMGIAADRLTSSGKGQTSPIADNGTDEGRAKNRRVEFVKQ